MPEVFHLARAWVYDNGASGHVGNRKDAQKFLQYITIWKTLVLDTAGGKVRLNKRLALSSRQLSGLLISTVLMKDLPELLSAGVCGKGGSLSTGRTDTSLVYETIAQSR